MSWSDFLDKLPLEISNKIIEYIFDEDVKNTKKELIEEIKSIKLLIDFIMIY